MIDEFSLIILFLVFIFIVLILRFTGKINTSDKKSKDDLPLPPIPSIIKKTSYIKEEKREFFLPRQEWIFIRKWSLVIGLIFLALNCLPPIKIEIVHSGSESLKNEAIKIKMEPSRIPLKLQIEPSYIPIKVQVDNK